MYCTQSLVQTKSNLIFTATQLQLHIMEHFLHWKQQKVSDLHAAIGSTNISWRADVIMAVSIFLITLHSFKYVFITLRSASSSANMINSVSLWKKKSNFLQEMPKIMQGNGLLLISLTFYLSFPGNIQVRRWQANGHLPSECGANTPCCGPNFQTLPPRTLFP